MEALYRKYRPTTFSDVVGQEHIERTLRNAIENGKVSHAYLFCGPRGTGKTTMARILAKALLCEKGPTAEPDGTCAECKDIAQGTHPDVYELDAASRTGVENVREEIISRVGYAPTRGSWKVYIIDEVHMLSPAAFNALLKTLEEPPDHVVFILCTTDPQRVLDTIQSRCQRFDFHRISLESIVARLGHVCAQEGVEFEAEALELIAHRSDGGMRNALTTLEQLVAFCEGKVTLEGAQSLLGSLDESDLTDIVSKIGRRDAAACFNWVESYVETGADLAQFVGDLAEYLRKLYLLTIAAGEVEIPVSDGVRRVMVEQVPLFGADRLSRMLEVLGELQKELRVASNSRLVFEIALTRLVRPSCDLTIGALAERVAELEATLASLASGSIASASAVCAVAPPSSAKPRHSAPVPDRGASIPAASVQTSTPAPAASRPVGLSATAQTPSPHHEPSQVASPQASPSQEVSAERSSANPSSRSSSGSIGAPSASTASPSRLTASVDLSNPATVQRLWHTVTSTLRKVSPPRGVLFMNAKVSADPSGQGIVIAFSADNNYAYGAAQKAEVQELLAQTLRQVAGGDVPFRLAVSGGAAPAAAAPQRQSAPQRNGRSADRDQMPRTASFPAPQAPRVENSRPSTPPMPRKSVEAAPSAMTVPGDSFDEVPLDVYDAAVPQDYDPSVFEAPASPRPPAAPTSPVAAAPPSPVSAAGDQASWSSASAAPSVAANPSKGEVGVSSGDERRRVVDVLTKSFGEGIKFEDVPN